MQDKLKQAVDSVKTCLSQRGSARLRAAVLSKRTLIVIEGDDALAFANDLTTNNLTRSADNLTRSADNLTRSAGGGCGFYAQTTAFLTRQGSLQQLCLALATSRGVLLECDRACLDTFAELLWKARLGRAVSFRWLKELRVVALFPESSQPQARQEKKGQEKKGQEKNGEEKKGQEKKGQEKKEEEKKGEEQVEYIFTDPRKPLAAMRLWHPQADAVAEAAGVTWVEETVYDAYRLSLSIVERAEEWEEVVRPSPFAFGLDALGAMDWEKNCYVGQEIVARIKYRARAPKKHVLPVRLLGRGGASVRVGDKVCLKAQERDKEENEEEGKAKSLSSTLCGEVLHAVTSAEQTILLTLLPLAPLQALVAEKIAQNETDPRKPLAALRSVAIIGDKGQRLCCELLLPRWLAGLWRGAYDGQQERTLNNDA